MSIRAEFEFNPLQLSKFRTALSENLKTEVNRAMNRIGVDFEAEMSKRFKGRRAGCVNVSQRLVSKTGALERSVAYQVTPAGGNTGAQLKVFAGGPGIPYTRVQEYGATIRGNPWLTVPLPANYTAGCNVRYPSARQLQITGATFVRKRNGKLIIYLRRTDGNVEALWELRRAVTIKPRLGFRRTWNSKKMDGIRQRRLTSAFASAISKAAARANVRRSISRG